MKLGYKIDMVENFNNKIAAIKAYRAITGIGLKESKDAIENGAATGILEMPNLPHSAQDLIKEFAKEGIIVTALEPETPAPPAVNDPIINISIEWGSEGGRLDGRFPLSRLPAIHQGLKKIIG